MLNVCKQCGTPLKRGQYYCMKCGYNTQTHSKEKLNKKHIQKNRSPIIRIILVIGSILLLGFLLFLLYKIGSPYIEDFMSYIKGIDRKTMQIYGVLLGIILVIESILSYKFMDDGFIKSAGQYIMLYLILLLLLYGYSIVTGNPYDLLSLPIGKMLIQMVVLAILFFLAKKLAMLTLYKLKINNAFVFCILFLILRVLTLFILMILLYHLVSNGILPQIGL